jgi:REP element-mobilizing transposase RayT
VGELGLESPSYVAGVFSVLLGGGFNLSGAGGKVLEDDPFFQVPPGFQGLDINRQIVVYRRNLPHWRQEHGTYFVTARLADALPPAVLQELRQERLEFLKLAGTEFHSEQWQAFVRQQTGRILQELDQGYGSCVLRQPAARDELAAALLHQHGRSCEIGCFVLMPNHWHALIRPYAGVELEVLLGRIKGFSAWQINRVLGAVGGLWGSESYDRLIRDGRHLANTMRYIVLNGKQACLPAADYQVWVSGEWEQAGWTAEAVISWDVLP